MKTVKNFVFVSPHFPHTYWQFCDRLHRNGINVLGIGDAPYDSLEAPLKAALYETGYFLWKTQGRSEIRFWKCLPKNMDLPKEQECFLLPEE